MGSVSGEYSSLVMFSGDWLVNLTVCGLILLGALGFWVWNDLWNRKCRLHRCTLHTKLTLAVSAVLVIGGTAAAVGYSMHKQKKNSENRLENELSENETPPDTENAVIFPKLTNQQDEPEMHCYPQTDSGFFYLEAPDLPAYDSEERRDILRQNTAFGAMDYDQAPRGLRYYDAESGETVFVCAKPNCLHDGSEFCTATTQNYFALSYPVVLDDAVYLVALDYREYLQNRDNCTKYPTVLLRYAPDGTEVSEIARLYLSETPYHCYADLIAHRGQLWINCVYSEELIITDENLDYSNQHQRGKWEMYCFEPQTKKLTTLMTSGELQNEYNPAGGMSCRLEPVGRSFRASAIMSTSSNPAATGATLSRAPASSASTAAPA